MGNDMLSIRKARSPATYWMPLIKTVKKNRNSYNGIRTGKIGGIDAMSNKF